MLILNADDDPVIRKLVRMHLTNAGHEVLEATNGQQAWELVQQRPIRFVISDWMMPEMEGPDLVRHIRSAGFPHYTYVILLTAQNGQDEIVSGLESGADDYLAKPFDPAELKARVNIGCRILDLEARLTEARREMEILAMHDGLTNLLNRRAIREHAVKELFQAAKDGTDTGFVMIDIDHFKGVNDLHGHLIGDQALRLVARTIMRSIRPQDAVGRWGGEEFLVVLRGAAPSSAVTAAERIRARVSNGSLPLADGSDLTLRISEGVMCSSQSSDGSLDTLLQRADEALYRAKHAGRDQVCAFSAELFPEASAAVR